MLKHIHSAARKTTAMLVSGLLASSMVFATGAALPYLASAQDNQEASPFTIEDVSDETFAPSPSIALTPELLSASSTNNRVSYLDAQLEAGKRLGGLITLVEPGEAESDVAMANDFTSGVKWADENAPLFVNRLDADSVATYAKTAYNNLRRLSNFDASDLPDTLAENAAYETTSEPSHTVDQLASIAIGELYQEEGATCVPIAKINVPKNSLVIGSPETDNISNWLQTMWCAYLRDFPEYTYWYSRSMPGFSLLPLKQTAEKDYYAIVIVTAWDDQSGTSMMRNSTWDTNQKITRTHNAMMSQVDAIVSSAPKTTDYEKIKYYNNWICDNNTYYTDYDVANDYIPWTAASGLLSLDQMDALVGKRQGPVCEGYSKAMQLLCQKSSIPVTVQTGRTYEAHMWNLIKLEDKWYVFDATHNSTGANREAWLAAGMDQVSGDRVIDDSVTYRDPITDEVRFVAAFANAPQIADTGYAAKPIVKTEIYLPDEPVPVFYGQTLREAIPTPSDCLKSNIPIDHWDFEFPDEPMNVLGERNVQVTAFPSDMYEQDGHDPETVVFPIVVVPAQIEVNVSLAGGENGKITYTGQVIEPAVTVTKAGTGSTVVDPSMYSVTYSDNVNMGTARALVESYDSSPYVFSKTVTFEIVETSSETPVLPTPPSQEDDVEIAIAGTPVYGDTVELAAKGIPNGAKVEYSVVKGQVEIVGSDNVKLNQIGEASIKATVTTKDGDVIEKTIALNVSKRPLTISAQADDKVYDGKKNVLGNKAEVSNIAEGDSAAITVKLENGTFDSADVGDRTATFKVSVSGSKSNCYSYPETVEAHAKITPAPVVISDLTASEQKLPVNAIGKNLPDTITLNTADGTSVTARAEWFADEEHTVPVGSNYKIEGAAGDKVSLYAKLTATGNHTGTGTMPVTFALSDESNEPEQPATPDAPGDGNDGNNGANAGNSGNANGSSDNDSLTDTSNPPITPTSTDYAYNSDNSGVPSTSNGNGSIISTGDAFPLVLVIMAVGVAAVGIAAVTLRRR